jgi:hypothetical protein
MENRLNRALAAQDLGDMRAGNEVTENELHQSLLCGVDVRKTSSPEHFSCSFKETDQRLGENPRKGQRGGILGELVATPCRYRNFRPAQSTPLSTNAARGIENGNDE